MMSNFDDFEAVKAEIEAVPDAAVVNRNMPVDDFIQDALYNLQHGLEDQEALVALGLPAEVLTRIPQYVGALRYIESLFDAGRALKKEALASWKVEAPKAVALRSEVLACLEFAFYGNAQLLSRVKAIRDGSDDADLVQDLSDISVLGKENLDLMTPISFDATLLDTAAALSVSLGELLAAKNGERFDKDPNKLLRDKAYTLLKQNVSELCRYGKFLYRNDEVKIRHYYSVYYLSK